MGRPQGLSRTRPRGGSREKSADEVAGGRQGRRRRRCLLPVEGACRRGPRPRVDRGDVAISPAVAPNDVVGRRQAAAVEEATGRLRRRCEQKREGHRRGQGDGHEVAAVVEEARRTAACPLPPARLVGFRGATSPGRSHGALRCCKSLQKGHGRTAGAGGGERGQSWTRRRGQLTRPRSRPKHRAAAVDRVAGRP